MAHSPSGPSTTGQTTNPDGFIARMFEVASGGTTTPTDMLLTGELAGIRLVLAKARRIRLDRKPDDAPQVVESWL